MVNGQNPWLLESQPLSALGFTTVVLDHLRQMRAGVRQLSSPASSGCVAVHQLRQPECYDEVAPSVPGFGGACGGQLAQSTSFDSPPVTMGWHHLYLGLEALAADNWRCRGAVRGALLWPGGAGDVGASQSAISCSVWRAAAAGPGTRLRPPSGRQGAWQRSRALLLMVTSALPT